jgi:hypothetical protein
MRGVVVAEKQKLDINHFSKIKTAGERRPNKKESTYVEMKTFHRGLALYTQNGRRHLYTKSVRR